MTTSVRVSVGGATLAVQVRGDGPPLLLVHGFPLDQSMWSHQLVAFSGWRRIAPDLRGAGASEAPPGEYSMARYADDLVMVLDAVGAKSAVCCGLSMGGYVLFELMRRHPERVRALILCDTKADADTPQGKQGRDELAALAEREGMAPVGERLLPKLLGRTTQARDQALVETVRAMVLRSPVTGVAGALRAMRDRPDSTALLGEIRVPTLVVGGAEDELTPPSVMQPMAQGIRGARYVEVPTAGHLCPLEQPDAVNEAVRDFLKGV
ncbi:MAG TPA: alpha/beta fold hydrolase [Gemmatimonadales bacterium]|jgi:3-oxoadipate enol-lactonase